MPCYRKLTKPAVKLTFLFIFHAALSVLSVFNVQDDSLFQNLYLSIIDMNTLSDDENIDKTVELLNKNSTTRKNNSVERSETHWSQASSDSLQRPAPKQFSEIDQSASSQAAASATMEVVGKLAFQDAVSGVDTDQISCRQPIPAA